MPSRLRSLALVAILALVALLAWFPRSVEGLKHPYTREGTEWFSRDPDGLYHARRVERALAEGEVADTDPRMDFPDGAPIPWPPYYDAVLAKALAPFAPEDAAQRWSWIERATASAPRLFGVLAALVAAFAAWKLAGASGALVAGATVALCRGTINYSVVGTGDHHAWVALLAALALLALTFALRRDALRSHRSALGWGVLLGLLVGLLVGSWVASLLYVLELQLALGWMLWRRSKEPLPALATLGFTLHVTALLVLLPAVLSSPWRLQFPWMVVNLSWFHVTLLALGALVFVPLLGANREMAPLATGTRLARRYPALVALVLLFLAGTCWALELAPARGIAEGFEWVSRADSFMDTVQESYPLVGARAENGVLFLALGYSVLVLPLALAWMAWRAFRHAEHELTPWVIATAALLPQALQQRRFADALAVPMAVALGWAVGKLVERVPSPALRRLAPVLTLALALLGQLPSVRSTWRRMSSGREPVVGSPQDVVLGERKALEWIRTQSRGDDAWSVLAHWDRGHGIEFVADAPSIATNFGSYIGLDSYRDPARFFLAESPTVARELLERRRVRYILAPSALMNLVPSMCRIAAPEQRDTFLAPGPQGALRATERWFGTLGARLLFQGTAVSPAGVPLGTQPGPLPFLRLVHVSPQRDARFPDPITGLPLPAAFVWEFVPAARVEIRGNPGEFFDLELDVLFAASSYRLPWRSRVQVGADGFARTLVPYSTNEPNGEGEARNVRWRLGTRAGTLGISELDVRESRTVIVP